MISWPMKQRQLCQQNKWVPFYATFEGTHSFGSFKQKASASLSSLQGTRMTVTVGVHGQSHCRGVEDGILEHALRRSVSLLYNVRLDGLTVSR